MEFYLKTISRIGFPNVCVLITDMDVSNLLKNKTGMQPSEPYRKILTNESVGEYIYSIYESENIKNLTFYSVPLNDEWNLVVYNHKIGDGNRVNTILKTMDILHGSRMPSEISISCKNLILFEINLEMMTKNKTAYLGACVCYGFQNTHVHRLNILGALKKRKKVQHRNNFFPVPVPFTSDVDEMMINVQNLNEKAHKRYRLLKIAAPLLFTPCRGIIDLETITLSCLKFNNYFLTGGYLRKYKNDQHMVTTFLHPTKTNIISCVMMSHSVDMTQVANRMVEFNRGVY